MTPVFLGLTYAESGDLVAIRLDHIESYSANDVNEEKISTVIQMISGELIEVAGPPEQIDKYVRIV